MKAVLSLMISEITELLGCEITFRTVENSQSITFMLFHVLLHAEQSLGAVVAFAAFEHFGNIPMPISSDNNIFFL